MVKMFRMKAYLILLSALLLGLCIQCKQAQPKDKSATAYQNVNVQQAKTLIKSNPQLVILDVRTPKETAEGIIQNAIEIDFKASTFESEIMKLDRAKSYLIYCRSGGRSSNACNLFEQNGFTDIYNLEGGYNAWSDK